MKLIIGGAFQGKREYAGNQFTIPAEDFIDGEKCAFSDIFSCAGIYHFHLYIRRMMQEGIETKSLAAELLEQNPDILIISNELGYGVVPIDSFERAYRETVGRICCRMAEKAEEVHRVVCGIGTVLKHA